ncbi:MAG: type I methionyl aminopeptidase [Firmicutes bacterium]|nr:type I methionyl aminopeptidase [Bacillota bacterium]
MINIKDKRELQIMRDSGKIAAQCLEFLISQVVVGNTPLMLDQWAEQFIAEKGGIPSFKGYMGYPASLCISVNEEVVHGIPTSRPFREGDLVSIDIGVIYQGYHSDMAVTVPVGKISKEKEKLISVTKEALNKGIEQARAGNHVSDISHVIQKYAEKNSFSVVRDLVGHGVGKNLHEEPQVPNHGKPGEGPVLEPGMTIAIEPMVNMGDAKVKVKDDKWTVVTVDMMPSAHFEHTIVVTENGAEVLTLP